jgi:ribosomal protein L30E
MYTIFRIGSKKTIKTLAGIKKVCIFAAATPKQDNKD